MIYKDFEDKDAMASEDKEILEIQKSAPLKEKPFGSIMLALFVGLGIIQVISGYIGIQNSVGTVWAVVVVFLSMLFRFTLPITIGSFFCAMNVWGWSPILAFIFAAPGIIFVVPVFLSTIFDFRRIDTRPFIKLAFVNNTFLKFFLILLFAFLSIFYADKNDKGKVISNFEGAGVKGVDKIGGVPNLVRESEGKNVIGACLFEAAKLYDIPPEILAGIAIVEGGEVGGRYEGKDLYLGITKINSKFASEFANFWRVPPSTALRWIADDACTNFAVSAWLLSGEIDKISPHKNGYMRMAISNYYIRNNGGNLREAEIYTNSVVKFIRENNLIKQR